MLLSSIIAPDESKLFMGAIFMCKYLENKELPLEQAFKQHMIADKKLRKSEINTKNFESTCIEYLKSTEKLVRSLDKTLDIKREEFILTNEAIKTHFKDIIINPVTMIGICIIIAFFVAAYSI